MFNILQISDHIHAHHNRISRFVHEPRSVQNFRTRIAEICVGMCVLRAPCDTDTDAHMFLVITTYDVRTVQFLCSCFHSNVLSLCHIRIPICWLRGCVAAVCLDFDAISAAFVVCWMAPGPVL